MMPFIPRTLTSRIALAYAVLSSVVAGVVFVLVYLTLAADLMRRMDDELLKTAKELRQIHETTGRDGARTELKLLEDTEGTNRMFARILSNDLTVIASSDMSAWAGLTMEGLRSPGHSYDSARFLTIAVPGRHHRARAIYLRSAAGSIYQIGFSLRDDDEILEDFRQVFTQAFVVLLVCGGFLGWLLTRRAMRGVARVREAALSIGTGDFHHRVPLGNEGQEIIDLASAFNEMIERIQGLIKGLKYVTDNIAHDLRSPITRMRGMAETTLTGRQDISEYQDMAGTVIEECDRMVAMINTMLEIAQADAGALVLTSSPVDMRMIIQDAYELFEVVAEENGIDFEIICPEKPLMVSGDCARLQRAISNLIDNAIKFTPQGGQVTLEAQERPAQISITVTDTGPGLEPQEQERIFERFYRGDRSRSTPGYGLGLSLVRAFIIAHGGEISVQSMPGKGCIFTINLPHRRSINGE